MPTHYAAIYGGIIGLLFGVVITLIYDIGIADAAYRSLILIMSGAWMGAILAGLNDLLSPRSDQYTSHQRHEKRSS